MSDNLLNKLTQLKLPAMAGSLIRQRETPQTYDELSFEERLTQLVDDELLSRETSRGTVEKKCRPEIPGNTGRAALSGLKRSAAEQMRELLNYSLHNPQENLLITGPTGCGKS
ncbi:ATP-binding protein [Escherichia coli]|nr:ATP-binding protein [Escherichia coli]